MKKITINFYNFFYNFEEFKALFVPFLLSDYEFEISNNPDFLFFSNLAKWGPEHTVPSVPQNFASATKIFVEGEYMKMDINRCAWSFTCRYLDSEKHYRLPYYAINLLQSGRDPNSYIKNNVDVEKIKAEKTKFCNYLSSNCTTYRDVFFRRLSEYKRVDAAGMCSNNMSRLPNRSRIRAEGSLHKPALEKLNFQRQYKFTMSFQNNRADWNLGLGYVTDILTEPMLVNSIPLYWGNPRIGEEFNTKSFISFHDFSSEREFIEFIIEVDNDDRLYEKILLEPWLIDNEIKKDHPLNLDTLHGQFRRIFG